MLTPFLQQDGRPVYIEKLGGIDLTAMTKITSEERMLTNLAVEYERLSDPETPGMQSQGRLSPRDLLHHHGSQGCRHYERPLRCSAT